MGKHKRLNVVGITGTYEQSGEKKNRYIKCGAVWVYFNDAGEVDGCAIELDATPVATPDRDGAMKLHFKGFDPDRERGQRQRGGGQQKPQLDKYDGDIPF